MRRTHLASLLVASIHLTATVSPVYAQSSTVKPVPYGPAQPVQYGTPAPAPTPVAPPAPAAVGRDVIYLKNGGLLRGTLIDVIPSSHARIQLETGEIATVQWSEINRIDHASTPPADAAPAPQQPAAPSVPQQPAAPQKKVLVHIEPPGQDVYLLADTGHAWERVCSAPCDKWMSTDPQYKLAGPSARQSKPFSLQGENGDRVTLDVSAASSSVFTLGVVGTIVGSASLLIGSLVYLVGAAQSATYCAFDGSGSTTSSASCSSNDGKGAEGAGGTMMLVGLVLGVAGIVAIATNSHTSLTQEVDEPVKPAAPRNDAWLRLPSWGDTSTATRTASAGPGMMLPLFSGSF